MGPKVEQARAQTTTSRLQAQPGADKPPERQQRVLSAPIAPEREEDESHEPLRRAESSGASETQDTHIEVAKADVVVPAEVQVQLNDFVGEHGAYQLALTALLFVRYVLLGLMANSGPLMTPDVTFYCRLPMEEVLLIMPNISLLEPRERELEIKEEFKQICQIDLHLYQNYTQLTNLSHTKSQARTTPLIVAAGQQRQQQQQVALLLLSRRANSSSNNTNDLLARKLSADASSNRHGNNDDQDDQQDDDDEIVNSRGSSGAQATAGQLAANAQAARIRECTDFTYQLAPDQGLTMTSEFDLVCERDWLRSIFQSLLSASIVVAHVFWGTFSDKFGRFQAQRICLVVSLVAGILSIFMLDFWTFTLTRALCSFGDLGMVVSLTTTVVELVGSRYRGLSVALVNFGYALGVSLLPYVVAYFENFRLVIAFTVLCHALTMPFVLATNESARWLLTNRKFKQARRELKRISRLNRSWRDLWSSKRACFICFRRSSTGASALDAAMLAQGGDKSQATQTTQAQQDDDGGESREADHRKSGGGGKRKLAANRLSEQRREQKRAFELLFGEFVAQLESQNMCDPCARRHKNEQLAPPLGRVPTISIECQAGAGAAEEGAREAAAPVGRGASSGQSASSSRASSASGQAATLGRSRQTERAASDASECAGAKLLASASAPSSNGPVQQLATLESRRQQLLEAKLKTLQLPPSLSRESSFCYDPIEIARDELTTRDEHQRQQEQQLEPRRHQPDCINLVAHQLSFMGRVNRLFRDKKLMICVFTIVWTTFNSELLYTSFIIINLEVGEDVYLNYILGGCMEALAAIMASLLLSYAPRRLSLIAFWLLISLSCFGLSLAHIDSHWAVWMLALAKFSQSSLSSIASVAAYESFPTFLRQSGSGLVFTLGMLGSVFAPLIFAEFDDQAGMDRVLMTFSVSSLTAAILIYLYLNETRNCELQ